MLQWNSDNYSKGMPHHKSQTLNDYDLVLQLCQLTKIQFRIQWEGNVDNSARASTPLYFMKALIVNVKIKIGVH